MIRMRTLVGALTLGLGLVLTGSAHAVPVTFTTTGAFGGGTPGTTTIVNGAVVSTATITDGTNTVVITFTGTGETLPDVDNEVPGTATDFGNFRVDATMAASDLDIGAVNSGNPLTFTLTINQTAPTVGSGSFVGTITGTVAIGDGAALLTYDNITTSVGPVQYILANLSGPQQGVPANTLIIPTLVASDGAGTDQEGLVRAVPEPTSVALVGMGLVGLVGLGLRRKMLQARAA